MAGVLDGLALVNLNQQSVSLVPNWKPEKREKKARARIKTHRKPKAERQQIDAVRAACVDRDGYCRIETAHYGNVMADGYFIQGEQEQIAVPSACSGPSQWCHMHIRRRSQTRNQAPEVRHDTAHSLMLCKFHHQEYDAHRLIITALTRKGADGPLKFRRATE